MNKIFSGFNIHLILFSVCGIFAGLCLRTSYIEIFRHAYTYNKYCFHKDFIALTNVNCVSKTRNYAAVLDHSTVR